MAAAVAEAFNSEASVDSILQAAVDYFPPKSAGVMRKFIEATLALAHEVGDYEVLRTESPLRRTRQQNQIIKESI